MFSLSELVLIKEALEYRYKKMRKSIAYKSGLELEGCLEDIKRGDKLIEHVKQVIEDYPK